MERITTLKEKSVVSLSSLRESTAPAKNQSVLNNLGENADGNLTYKGEVVGGVESKIQVAEFSIDDSEAAVRVYTDKVMTIEADLPENARVKRIELLDETYGINEYVNLEDMTCFNSIDNEVPYFFIFPKNKFGAMRPVAAHICFPLEGNDFYYRAQSYNFTGTLKIYYEIEE